MKNSTSVRVILYFAFIFLTTGVYGSCENSKKADTISLSSPSTPSPKSYLGKSGEDRFIDIYSEYTHTSVFYTDPDYKLRSWMESLEYCRSRSMLMAEVYGNDKMAVGAYLKTLGGKRNFWMAKTDYVTEGIFKGLNTGIETVAPCRGDALLIDRRKNCLYLDIDGKEWFAECTTKFLPLCQLN